LFVAPEGAACLPALRKLIQRGDVDRNEEVVLFNTGAGIKYIEAMT
jgi:threonine synthase